MVTFLKGWLYAGTAALVLLSAHAGIPLPRASLSTVNAQSLWRFPRTRPIGSKRLGQPPCRLTSPHPATQGSRGPVQENGTSSPYCPENPLTIIRAGTRIGADAYLDDFRVAFGWIGTQWTRISPDPSDDPDRLTDKNPAVEIGSGYWVLYYDDACICP